MTYAGAKGETASQMASTLGFTLDPSDVESGFGALLSAINAEGQSGSFTLNTADALWLQQGFPLETEFLNLMQANFGGGVNQVDYIDAAEAARETINNWVSQQTNGKIQNLIPEGQLNDLTRLVLTNAVYFNGQWASGFNTANTYNAPFTLSDGSQDSVATMHQTGNFSYMESDGYQVLDMPYQGNQLSMDILLPTSGTTTNTLPANLGDWLQGLSPQYVDVSLPKFKINTSFSLNDTLQTMGMTDAFMRTADFTGIHDPSTDGENLYIGNVDHQAYIDVDESGTEAAAATGVVGVIALVVVPQPVPIEFDADHPFEFVIRDDQSGAILFQGQVVNPDPSATVSPAAPGSAAPTLPGPIQFANPGGTDPGGSNSGGSNPVARPVGTTPINTAPVAPPVAPAPVAPAPVAPIAVAPVPVTPPPTSPVAPAPISTIQAPNPTPGNDGGSAAPVSDPASNTNDDNSASSSGIPSAQSPAANSLSLDFGSLPVSGTSGSATPTSPATPAVVGAGGPSAGPASGADDAPFAVLQPTTVGIPAAPAVPVNNESEDEGEPSNSSATLTSVDGLFASWGA
jgi:serpin B